MVGRPGGGDGGRVGRGLGGGVESAGQVGPRELRLLAGVGEESRGERGGRERGHGRGALARPYRATAEAVGGGRGGGGGGGRKTVQKNRVLGRWSAT